MAQQEHSIALSSDPLVASLIERLQTVVTDLGVEVPTITLERPNRPEHGDWSSNVALQLAKQLKQSPLVIAQRIAELFPPQNEVAKVEAVAPGFVNFHLSDEYFTNSLARLDKHFGQGTAGKGKQAMVEFGQPNTHKAVTVGHLKSAISGLATVSLLQNAGYKVIKANYFGDVGMHVAQATWGYLQKEAPSQAKTWSTAERMNYVAQCYVYGAKEFKENEKVEAEIRVINKMIYAKKKGSEYSAYQLLRKWSIAQQDAFFGRLGIVYDRQYPESEVYPEAIKTVKKYQNKMFTKSKGAWIYDGRKEGLTTWVFLTSEGNPTYSAKDLALAAIKFKEYPKLDLSIIHTSVEQADYFKVVIRVLEQILPKSKEKYFHLPFGWLLFNNKKRSSRMGGVPTAEEVIDEALAVAKQKVKGEEFTPEERSVIAEKVALAGLKFLILSHEFTSNINYDPEQFLSLEGFSGPYLLYSYARSRSIARKAEYTQSQAQHLEMLNEPVEHQLIRLLLQYPEVAARAAATFQPHLLCTYLFNVAQQYNLWYNELPIMNEFNRRLRDARLFLNWASGTVLHNGLAALGIETLEKM